MYRFTTLPQHTFLILTDKCYRTKEIHHGPFGTDLLAVGLDEYFIINGVGLYKYLPAVIILPYFIYDFNGGDSFYQIVTAVLYNAGKNKQLWMTKPSQGCLNALQYLLCTIATSESWSFMNGEQYVNGSVLNILILSWVNAHFLVFILGKAVLSKCYKITKASELSWIMYCLKYAFICTEQVLTLHTDEFSLSQL